MGYANIGSVNRGNKITVIEIAKSPKAIMPPKKKETRAEVFIAMETNAR